MVKKLLVLPTLIFLFLLAPMGVVGQSCPTTVSISSDQGTVICSGTIVTFTANPNGGSNHTYQWFLNDNILTGETAKQFRSSTLSNSDKVKVRVTSNSGDSCAEKESTVTMTVNATAPVSFRINANKTSICPGGSVTFSSSPITNGGNSPAFQWKKNGDIIPGANQSTFTTTDISSSDKITLEVTSSAQCADPVPATSDNEISVNVNSSPTLSTVNGSVCAAAQSSVDLNTLVSGNGASITFYVSEANAINKTGAINPVVSPTSQTTYYVRSELPTGCFATDTIVISINPLPSVDAGPDQAICPGGSFDLASIGSGTNRTYYTSQNNASNKTNALSYSTVAPNSTTTYYVRSENSNGCYNTDSITISINPLPTLSTNNGSVCAGGQTSSDLNSLVSTNGTATFYTSQANADNKVNAINANVNPTSQTTYYVRSELSTGCFTTDTIVISIDAVPTITVSAGSVCASGQSSIDLKNIVTSNGTTITFHSSQANADNGSSAINSIVSPTSAATYYVRSENSNGCYNTAAIPITVNDLPTVNAGEDQEICIGSSFNLSNLSTGNGTLSYYTSQANAASKTNPLSNSTVSPTSTTTYYVRSESSTGCYSIDDVVVTVKPITTLTLTSSNNNQTLCRNTAIATISYSIGGGGTGADVTGLPSGVRASYNPSTKVLTISGTPTVAGTFDFDITTTGCGTASATGTIVIDAPITSATPVFEKINSTDNPTAICPVVSGLIYSVKPIPGATSYQWTFPSGWTATTGSLNNGIVTTTTNSVTVNVTGSAATGDRNITVRGRNSCGTTNQTTLSATVNTFSYANAGPDQIVCKGINFIQLNGEVGGAIKNQNDYDWSDNGAGGTFNIQGNNKLTATYTLPASTKNNGGTVTLNLTTKKPSGSCEAATDSIIITVLKDATINSPSNRDQTLCINTAIEPIAFTIAEAGTGATASGLPEGITGSYSDGVFTLSGTPTSAGTFNYTINTTGNCSDQQTSRTGIIKVDPLTTADAGMDLVVCQSSDPTAITLTGASVGGGATTGAWSITSPGGGTVSSTTQTANPQTVTYTPAAGFTGEIELTLTTNSPGECAAITDVRKIIIEPAPTVEAGDPYTICQSSSPAPITLYGATVGGGATTAAWSITSGGGTLSSTAQTANPQTVAYTPAADYHGEVILTLTTNAPGTCDEVLDTRTIKIDPVPIVDAGGPDTVCQSSSPQPITLTGASVGGGGSTAAWSITSGGGILSSTEQTTNPQNITYTPAADFEGTVTLTLTTNTPGTCTAVTDTREITIESAPIVNAGNNTIICQTETAEPISLTGASIGGGARTAAWSIVSGEGTLSSTAQTETPQNVAFTPAQGYIGEIILKLTTNAPGTCEATEDTLSITINPAAVVNVGEDQIICSTETATMNATLQGGAISGTWTSSGSGTFSNDSPTAIYTPSDNDVNTGSVTLTFTSNDPEGPCEAVSDAMVLTIKEEILITTQPQNVGVCVTEPAEISVVAYGDDLSYQWYKDDSPVSNTSNTSGANSATLSFSQATIADTGSYYVVIGDDITCAVKKSNTVTLNVNQDITIDQQPVSQTICEGETVTFNIVAQGAIDSYQWRKNGVDINGEIASSYTLENAVVSDSDSYDVVIFGTGGTCDEAYSTTVSLTVSAKSADPGSASASEMVICLGETTMLNLQGGGGGTEEEIKWYTDSDGITLVGTGNNLEVEPTETTTYYGRYETPTPCSYNSAFAEVTVTVNYESTIDLTSEAETASQTLCINNSLNEITYAVGGGATGASIPEGSLPSGVEWTLANGVFTISGTPTEAGTFPYTITTEGPCTTPALEGTIIVNPAPEVSIASEEQSLEICFDGTAYNITAGAATENTTSIEWSVPDGTGTITNENSLTEATFTPAEGVTSPVTLTLTGYGLGGCSVPATVTKEIFIQPLPTVTDIVYAGGVTEFCTNENSTAPNVTGTNAFENGNFSWKPAEGETATNKLKIDTTSGAITAGSDPGVYNVTYSTPTGAICDVQSRTIQITITKLPVATFSYGTTDYCKETSTDPTPTITGDAGGTFSGTSGLVIDPNTGVIDVSESIANNPEDENDTHVVTYSFPEVNGCGEVYETFNVRIDSRPVGGELKFAGLDRATYLVCHDATSGSSRPIELSGHYGTVLKWQKSDDPSNPNSWIDIAHTEESYSGYSGLTKTTLFRAVLSSGSCGVAYSKFAVISVIPADIKPDPVQSSLPEICIGTEVQLTSELNYSSNTEIAEGGTFNNANPKDWLADGCGNCLNAGNSNSKGNTFALSATNGANYSGVYYAADNKFAIAHSVDYSVMQTPIFSTFGLAEATLEFNHSYKLDTGSSIRIEISTDGGATYDSENPLLFVPGPATLGPHNNFPEMNIDLDEYVGRSNLRIRFIFDGIANQNDNSGSSWAIDNVAIPDRPVNIASEWSYTNAQGEQISVENQQNITVKPDKIGLNTFKITSYLITDDGAECRSADPNNTETVDVYVFDIYTSTATADVGLCGQNNFALTGHLAAQEQGSALTFPTPDGFSAPYWKVEGPSGYSFVNPDPNDTGNPVNNPNAIFVAPNEGTYTLQWAIERNENDGRTEAACPPDLQAITVTVKNCSTLDFDGEDDFVDLGEEYTGDYSIEAWIRPEATTGTIISTKNLEINMEDLPNEVTPNNRWYHIAVDSEGTLYVDGINSGSISKSGTERAFIGARWNAPNADNHFAGWIEEVRIWNGKISQENIRFTMNQRLKPDGNIGVEVDMDHPDAPEYQSLAGYYQLLANNILNGGYTPDLSGNPVNGKLRNMETTQENTAPLPYTTAIDNKLWTNNGTEADNGPWTHWDVWDVPNASGINGEPIEWNIVRTSNYIESGLKDIKLLGLIVESNELDILNTNDSHDETNSGQSLEITHYLKVDGILDLTGESQLLQPMESIVDAASSGYLERDQQGTASSYNYNYWSPPVSPGGNNAPYTIAEILMDGTTSSSPVPLSFGNPYAYADNGYTGEKRISNYWLHKFHGTANDYGSWKHVGSTGTINTGEGFSMKGTSGSAAITALQNYTFKGIPNNGTIRLNIGRNQNYLIGNPYPSAIDALEFIKDNLAVQRNGQTVNVFNGTLYFWSHFSGKTHYLQEYVGGYATFNNSGGVRAYANDERINATGEGGGLEPKQYIPVGQAFFVNTAQDTVEGSSSTIHGGDLIFKNSQRVYQREIDGESVFHKPEDRQKGQATSSDQRAKIWIKFRSPKGYHRQLLVTADPNASNGYDLGYDAPLIENNTEDMYWFFNNYEFVIQGVGHFNDDQKLPLGFKIKEEGDFTISIDQIKNIAEDMPIYLRDSVHNVYHDLRKEAYKSSAGEGTINDRFSIVFSVPQPEIEEPEVEEPVLLGDFDIMYVNGSRKVLIKNPHLLKISRIYLHNVLGQQVMTYYDVPEEAETNLPVHRFSSGVYIVKAHTEDGIKTKKIIIE